MARRIKGPSRMTDGELRDYLTKLRDRPDQQSVMTKSLIRRVVAEMKSRNLRENPGADLRGTREEVLLTDTADGQFDRVAPGMFDSLLRRGLVTPHGALTPAGMRARGEALSRQGARVNPEKGKRMRLPKWHHKKGWVGGDSRTLYAFTDRLIGTVSVQPGGPGQTNVGPNADVRVATRGEAEQHWQDPLSEGWTVAESNPVGGPSDAEILAMMKYVDGEYDISDGNVMDSEIIAGFESLRDPMGRRELQAMAGQRSLYLMNLDGDITAAAVRQMVGDDKLALLYHAARNPSVGKTYATGTEYRVNPEIDSRGIGYGHMSQEELRTAIRRLEKKYAETGLEGHRQTLERLRAALQWNREGRPAMKSNATGVEYGRRRRNPQTSLTYGVMPSRSDFAAVVGPNLPFYAELRGEEEDILSRAGYDTGDRLDDPDDLYDIINNLITMYDEGDDVAGRIASVIMTVSGFEWI